MRFPTVTHWWNFNVRSFIVKGTIALLPIEDSNFVSGSKWGKLSGIALPGGFKKPSICHNFLIVFWR